MTMPNMIPWIGPSYKLAGNSMASRESINCYLQSGEGLAKYSELLIGTPGTQLTEDLESLVGDPNRGCRGLWLTGASPYEGGNLYWCYGSKVGYTYKDETTGLLQSVVIGDIGLDTKRVSFTDNGFSVVLATGQSMYTIDIFTDVLKDITADLPFTLPLQVVYSLGRLYAISADPTTTARADIGTAIKSNLIWYSELSDANTWDGLSFIPADLNADPIKSIVVRQGDLWAFGTRSYQIFSTTSDPDEPMAYAPGSGTLIGIDAPNTAVGISDNIFWLGSNSAGRNVVFMGAGYGSTRISDHGIEAELDKLQGLTSEAYGFSYQDAGHLFYCLTIPPGSYVYQGENRVSLGKTYCYDVLTGVWHERVSRNPKTGELSAWQPLFSSFAWGKIIVGNLLHPVLLELKNDVFTDYDPTTIDKKKPITRMYQGPILFENLQTFTLYEFVWDIITGHGPLNGQSAQPTAQLQVSLDGGNTWGNIITENLYKTGEYAGQVSWRLLGTARAMAIRVIITEDLRFMAGQARVRTKLSGRP